MKTFIAAAFALALLALPPVVSAQEVKARLAIVSGTITEEITTAEGVKRTKISEITNERLFREFGVSEADYALIIYDGAVYLVNRANNNQSIDVFVLQDASTFADDAKETITFAGPVNAPHQPAGVFAELAGTLSGKLDRAGKVFSGSLNLIALGKNPAGPTAESRVLIKCKVRSGKVIVLSS